MSQYHVPQYDVKNHLMQSEISAFDYNPSLREEWKQHKRPKYTNMLEQPPETLHRFPSTIAHNMPRIKMLNIYKSDASTIADVIENFVKKCENNVLPRFRPRSRLPSQPPHLRRRKNFGLWRVCFPPILIRTDRRLLV